MGHGREESGLQAIRRFSADARFFEIAGSLFDLEFEVRVQVAQRLLSQPALRDVERQDEQPFRNGLRAHIEPARLTVREEELRLDVTSLSLIHTTAQHREHLRLDDAGPHLGHRVAEELDVGSAVLNFGGAVQIEVSPIEVEELTPFHDVVERAPHPNLAVLALQLHAACGV